MLGHRLYCWRILLFHIASIVCSCTDPTLCHACNYTYIRIAWNILYSSRYISMAFTYDSHFTFLHEMFLFVWTWKICFYGASLSKRVSTFPISFWFTITSRSYKLHRWWLRFSSGKSKSNSNCYDFDRQRIFFWLCVNAVSYQNVFPIFQNIISLLNMFWWIHRFYLIQPRTLRFSTHFFIIQTN